MLQRHNLAYALLLLAFVGMKDARGDEPAPRWEQEIAPLLKRHCVKCHGPAKSEGKLDLSTGAGLLRGGEQGAAIVPHDLDGSLIWKRIQSNEMPPESPLGETDRMLLQRWIRAGSPGLRAAGGSPWAFRKLSPVSPGGVASSDRSRSRGIIDGWIEQPLRERGLSINTIAEKATLLRRLSLDLRGTPPDDQDVIDRLDEDLPDGQERWVDRYLASPAYGERWGKYWLDAAGYADSNGYFNADTDRPFAYRYRDYVIRSMNRDLGFDQFVRQQLAGDELAGPVPEAGTNPEFIELLEATHYLRNGQDGSGESDGNPDEVRVDRYTALESSMQIVASSLMGLTLQCAKCHDHKFEPLTQRDYYQFQAILYPVFNLERWQKPNERFVLAPLPGEKESWERQLAEINAEWKQEQVNLTAWLREHRPRGEVLYEDSFEDGSERLAAHWSATAPGDNAPGGSPAVHVNAATAPGAMLVDGHLQILEVGGSGNRWLSTTRSFDWTPDEKGEAIQVTFDLIADKVNASQSGAERIGYYIAARDFDDSDSVPGGNILIDGNPGGSTSVHVDYPGADGQSAGSIGVTGYAAGRNYGVRVTNQGEGRFLLEHLVDGVAESKSIALKESDLPDGGFAWEYCCGRSFVVDNVCVERFRVASAATMAEPPEFAAQLKQRREIVERLSKRRNELSQSPPGKIAWATDMVPEPPEVFLLERGNYGLRKESVPAMPPAVLCDPAKPFAVPSPANEARSTGRRLAFANWLFADDSRAASLVARVHVNRIWQHHFGTGLVATPENLGLSGAPPTHPELLDTLAHQFIAGGWSQKPIHRRILLSATYCQSSAASEAAVAGDSDGHLLSRYPLRRLDAEAIRDSMLSASGDLDRRFFGPYVPTSRDGAGEVVAAETNPGARRRSIYLNQRRTQVVSFLAVFDAPSIVFNSLSRPRSTMPLQSLALLNSEFAANRARSLAERLVALHPQQAALMINEAYLRLVARPASAAEMELAEAFIEQQSRTYAAERSDAEKSSNTVRALADLCQMLMASNEFLYWE